jgi:hypothetical protein
MKKLIAGIGIVSILAFGTLAFAHGYGGWGGGHMMGSDYGGHMTGPGYSGHMTSQGYGGHMRGWNTQENVQDQKFLDETADQRKDLHDKRFEYFEARRDPATNIETLTKLEKEIGELQNKISEKAPRTAYQGRGGYGCY